MLLLLFRSKVPRDFCLAVVISPTHSTGRKSIGRSRPISATICLMSLRSMIPVCLSSNHRQSTHISRCGSMSSVCPTLSKWSVCHSRAAHSHTHTPHTHSACKACTIRWTGIDCPPASVRPTRGPSFIGDGDAMPIADIMHHRINAIALTMH